MIVVAAMPPKIPTEVGCRGLLSGRRCATE